ncbi:response regulator [Acuticoccus sp. I52.16.1]|uniref:response regulator n=1 Tax=Acuticoccus sp. I52.16.1 TaxID=2928472 RepID=UPI001FD30ACE|nr:response regulator [Acuticoccus sp. I52.16.1]UOM34108.1 response regulator [Acuticoccus sp. I52.16.1]
MTDPSVSSALPTDLAATGGKARRILIVEDEALIGFTLKMLFEDEFGFEVLGPIGRLDEAVRAAREETVSFAILDVNIIGGEVFPAADILQARGIPFIFHTGHGVKNELRSIYAGSEVLSKPTPDDALMSAVRRMLV